MKEYSLVDVMFGAMVAVLALWLVGQLIQGVAGGLMTVLEFVG